MGYVSSYHHHDLHNQFVTPAETFQQLARAKYAEGRSLMSDLSYSEAIAAFIAGLAHLEGVPQGAVVDRQLLTSLQACLELAEERARPRKTRQTERPLPARTKSVTAPNGHGAGCRCPECARLGY